MKKTRTSLAITLCLILLLASCSNTPTEPTTDPAQGATSSSGSVAMPTEPSTLTEPSTPNRTDINLILNTEGNSMDPHNSGVTLDLQVQEQIYEGLVHVDESANVTLRLAESYSISDDGLVYTFKIRDDVLFHNGDALKVSDVVWSINRAMSATQMKVYAGPIEHVEALDDSTVAVTLKFVYAPFINYIYMIKILSEAEVTAAGDLYNSTVTRAGTGPYMLAEYNPNSKIVLTAFEDYYRGAASIKTVNYFIIPDSSTALIAFQNGELDFSAIPTSNWDEIQSSGRYSTEMVTSGAIRYLALNVGQDGPLADKKVRQAIQHAIDKEAVVLIAADGLGVPADHMTMVGMFDGAVDTDWVYEYNPERAKQLLTEAGYPEGVDIGVIDCSTMKVMAEAIQAQLEAVGIKSQVGVGESATLVVDWRAGNYDALAHAYTPAFSYDFYRRYNDYTIEVVFMKYDRNPDTDHQYITEMFDKGAAEIDLDKRNAIYKELEEYLMDAAAWVPIFYPLVPYAWDPDLNATGYIVYYEIYDWFWK